MLNLGGSTNLYDGSIVVGSGLVRVSGNYDDTPVTVDGDGSLGMLSPGEIGPVTVESGAKLWLTTNGMTSGRTRGLTLRGGSSTLAGDGISPVMGSIQVQGTVTIEADASFATNLGSSFTGVLGTTYTVIDNDGTDPVSGTFFNLPEGGVHSGGAGGALRISYAGGTGNDVVLTSVSDFREYRFSEGAAGPFFTTEILIANPNAEEAMAETIFTGSGGTGSISLLHTLPPYSHKTCTRQRHCPEPGRRVLDDRAVVQPAAAHRRADHVVGCERLRGAYRARARGSVGDLVFRGRVPGRLLPHVSAAGESAELAERRDGAVLARVGAGNRAHVELDANGGRITVDPGLDADLVDRSFGMVVTFAQPAYAERAMYFGNAPLFTGGHASAGATAPSPTWFLAEGATGPFFESYVLLANPNDDVTDVTLTYLPATGVPVTTTKSLLPRGRLTINVEGEAPSLSNAAVSTQIAATRPIIVERSQYWPDPAPVWHEAHNSFGVTALGTRWGLAEGRVGGTRSAQTYILLVNPGTTAANVTIQFLREGQIPVTKTFSVQPTSRFNVAVPGPDVPELANENFGAVITSISPSPWSGRSIGMPTVRSGPRAQTRPRRGFRSAVHPMQA